MPISVCSNGNQHFSYSSDNIVKNPNSFVDTEQGG